MTSAPSLRSWFIIGIETASRMSSVFGLKAKPRTAILLPFTVVWSSEPMLKISTWFRVFSKPNKGNRVQE